MMLHFWILLFINKFSGHFCLSSFHALYLASILACIFCIVHGLGTLKVARKIQVTGSLKVDDLFIANSWV